MHRSTVVDGDAARGTQRERRARGVDALEIAIVEATHPAVAVVLVEQIAEMTTRNEPDVSHIRSHVAQKHTDGERRVVRMWPELDVLVPFDLFAAARRLEVQFAVMKLDIRSDQVLDEIDDFRSADELPVGLVQIGRRNQAPQPRLARGVVGFDVEQGIRFGQFPAVIDEFRRDLE